MTEYQRETGSNINPEDVSVEELKDELRDLDQPVSGNKDELIERLEDARKDAVANQEDPVAALASADPEDEDAPHEVRGDGSKAYFSNEGDAARAEDREKASYSRERGTTT